MPSITVACNFFNERFALPGFLESASQYADKILMYETGPQGEHSSDGSIEIIEKFGGVDLRFGSIDQGFGIIRTNLLRMCSTDWCIILDSDERIFRYAPRLVCTGTDSYDVGKHYPELADVNLSVQANGFYDQIAALKSLMRPEYDAIVTSRRHFQTFGHERPSQNWHHIADWQARILRCVDRIGYRPGVVMHEQLVDFSTGNTPRWYQPHESNVEIFHDHYHLPLKRMEMDQRRHDIAVYDSLCEGKTPPTLEQFRHAKGILEPTGDCA